jgi:hypothetical protein
VDQIANLGFGGVGEDLREQFAVQGDGFHTLGELEMRIYLNKNALFLSVILKLFMIFLEFAPQKIVAQKLFAITIEPIFLN